MRRTKRNGCFIMRLLFNMLLNFEGIVPAAVLLALHYALKWSVWWAALAAALWILWLILWMLFLGWAGRCSSAQNPSKENKNPYSAGNKKNREA